MEFCDMETWAWEARPEPFTSMLIIQVNGREGQPSSRSTQLAAIRSPFLPLQVDPLASRVV